MSNGLWVFSAVMGVVATATLVPLGILMHQRHAESSPPLDFEDTTPEDHPQTNSSNMGPAIIFEELPKPNESVVIMSTRPEPIKRHPSPILLDPAIQVAQDNLNYKLWHKLLWLIPNTTWIQTQHQSLVDVQWLCLGPDYYCFIARAELHHDEWKWSFTKA